MEEMKKKVTDSISAGHAKAKKLTISAKAKKAAPKGTTKKPLKKVAPKGTTKKPLKKTAVKKIAKGTTTTKKGKKA
jgi:hypothetical protein